MLEKIKQNRFKILITCCTITLLALGAVWKIKQTSSRQLHQKSRATDSINTSSGKYVQVFRVTQDKFQDALTGLMGTVKSSSLELKCTQEETLIKYHFKPGDFVKKGQIIAEQDHTRTRSRLRQAQIALERKQSLYEVGGASKIELEEAREIVKIAQKDYDDTFIRAPKNGYLGEVLIQEGELVNRQNPVAYFVSDDDYFFVEASVIEGHISDIHAGQKALVHIDAISSDPIESYVLSVSPEFSTTSRMVPVRIKIPQKYSKQLRPGLSAVCEIITFAQDSLIIPKTALIRDQEKVFVVNADQKVEERVIKLGYSARDYTTVLQGLSAGELVVLRPEYAEIKTGDKVRYGKPQVYPASAKTIDSM